MTTTEEQKTEIPETEKTVEEKIEYFDVDACKTKSKKGNEATWLI